MAISSDIPDLEAHVLALGREGLSREEITARLGLSADELDALEAKRPSLELALRRAEAAARGWWEAAGREAVAAGVRGGLAGWAAQMRWRFGVGPAAEMAAAAAAEAAAAGAQAARARGGPQVGVIIDIPCNGRWQRLLPGGLCPQSKALCDCGRLEEIQEDIEDEIESWGEDWSGGEREEELEDEDEFEDGDGEGSGRG
jgi:hypothetical protein